MSLLRRMRLAPSRLSDAWAVAAVHAGSRGRVTEMVGFELRMWVHAPPRLRAGQPLVVVLHGCGQRTLLVS